MSLKELPNNTISIPTAQEIYAWTLRQEARASCFVRDALTMKAAEDGLQFYWLNRVPCRTLRLVGMVVGINASEDKIWYTLDDGTGVIECRSKRERVTVPLTKDKPDEATVKYSSPLAHLGSTVAVVGKIGEHFASKERQLQLDSIELCSSPNDECYHRRDVAKLHRDYYSGNQPFTIPKMQAPPDTLPTAPKELNKTAPSPSVSEELLAQDTPEAPLPLVKLRHPSRLRSREITSDTFKRYIKHYMDNSPDASAGDASAPLVYTLSQLRRVPELALLAHRTVQVEIKKREKAAKLAGKKSRSSASSSAKDEMRAKTKRLFQYAAVKLREEGSILIWQPGEYSGPKAQDLPRSQIWTSQTSATESSIFSSVNITDPSNLDQLDVDNLSEPEEDEELYGSLTTAYLADAVEGLMLSLMDRSKGWHKRARCPHSSGTLGPLRELNGGSGPWCITCPHPPGPTVKDIHDRLRKSDSRWDRVGDWALRDALSLLSKGGRVWEVGDGRWELCL